MRRGVVRGAAVVAGLGLVAVSHAIALAVISGRTRPPDDRLQAARAALAAASTRAGPRWAADELRQAARLLAGGEAEFASQSGRLWPRRDFTTVASRLWAAETAARRAHQQAEERRVAARAEATDAVEEAAGLLEAADALAAATSLPREERMHLARARFRVSEALALADAEEYALAAARAETGRRELEHALGPSLVRARRYASAEQVRTWRRWIAETRAWSRASGRAAVVVVKERNEVTLFERGEPVRSYEADIGSDAVGRKLRAGDQATPEGRYRIVTKKDKGRSRYHKALLLDYPNEADRRRIAEARRAGHVPEGAGPGGLIELHGEGGRGRNWTEGCVALRNDDMDDLFARVGVGSWVTIVGGDGGNGTFSSLVSRLDGTEQRP